MNEHTNLLQAASELAEILSAANSETHAFNVTEKKLFGELKNLYSEFSSWLGASQIAAAAINQTKESVAELSRLNSIVTDISKATVKTSDELKELSKTAFRVSSKFGKKPADFLTNTLELSQSGYSNSSKLAELATIAQSAGIASSELASQYLIASDAAYGYGGNIQKLTALLDSQHHVASKNAIELNVLADATKVAAAQAAIAGVNENELTAALATMLSNTESDAQSTAKALEGILMNLRKIPGEVDDEIFDKKSFVDAEKRLHRIGIATEEIIDGTSQLRDPMDILKDLAKVYNSLPADNPNKTRILSDIGGKQGDGQLAALLENWTKYESTLKDFENASGSALRSALESADSLEGSFNRVSNTWTETVNNLYDTDALKSTVNGFNELLKVINMITAVLGPSGTFAAALGGILGGKGLGRLISRGAHGCEAQES